MWNFFFEAKYIGEERLMRILRQVGGSKMMEEKMVWSENETRKVK